MHYLETNHPRALALDVRSPVMAWELAVGEPRERRDRPPRLDRRAAISASPARTSPTRARCGIRYAVISRLPAPRSGADATALIFSVHDHPGALHDILQHFKERSCNLRRIQSRPVAGEGWEYVFYVEVSRPHDGSRPRRRARGREARSEDAQDHRLVPARVPRRRPPRNPKPARAEPFRLMRSFFDRGRSPAASSSARSALVLLAGCGGNNDYGLIGGEKVDASLVDRDPLALLPSGVLVLSQHRRRRDVQVQVGATRPRRSSRTLLPLGPESNFVPQRDVTRVVGGIYAMQGADFCAVVQGNFDVAAIQRAVDARAITIDGAPLVKTRYAGNDLYTAGNLGFTLVTSHTALSGNETGMRRALDRLRFGKLERSVPEVDARSRRDQGRDDGHRRRPRRARRGRRDLGQGARSSAAFAPCA